MSNGTLQVDSDFDSTTLRLGASATGVFSMPRIEIWPELSFSYAKSRVGSQAVAAQAYGLTANNLNLAGGDVEMGQLMFMPQIKWPLGDGRDCAGLCDAYCPDHHDRGCCSARSNRCYGTRWGDPTDLYAESDG